MCSTYAGQRDDSQKPGEEDSVRCCQATQNGIQLEIYCIGYSWNFPFNIFSDCS